MYKRRLISLIHGQMRDHCITSGFITTPCSSHRKYPRVAPDYYSRHHSTGTCNISQQLTQRGVVQVRGPDSADFLQGLVTNDIHCPHGLSLFAMMLNIKGRVLYDMIIHSVGRPGEPCYLLDVDRCVTPELISIIKKFKIRKKVDISDVTDEMKVWAILPPEVPSGATQLDLKLADQSGVLCCSNDPRLHALGYRAVLSEGISAANTFLNVTESTERDLHRQYRYLLGIGEGVVDHPPGNCLPLECNLVFLNGVSFDKGCYIGQELTARSHHTGVVRKRLMPVHFASDCEDKLEDGIDMCNSSGKKVGKLRGVHRDSGLALVRLSEVKGSLKLEDNSGCVVEAKASKPFWWPAEVR